jgi:hypothetical protein
VIFTEVALSTPPFMLALIWMVRLVFGVRVVKLDVAVDSAPYPPPPEPFVVVVAATVQV